MAGIVDEGWFADGFGEVYQERVVVLEPQQYPGVAAQKLWRLGLKQLRQLVGLVDALDQPPAVPAGRPDGRLLQSKCDAAVF